MSQGPPPAPAAPPRPAPSSRFRRVPGAEGPEHDEPEALNVNSGATVREVSETFGVSSAEIIKKLMQQGEMATLTQTLTDETVELLAEEFDQQGRDRPRRRRGRRGTRLRGRRGRSRPPAAGRHRDGPRRPRQDLAARRDPHDRGRGGRGRRDHPAHRRLPGAPGGTDDHLPRHAGTPGVHRHARPRREGHRRRDRRRRRRRRRHAADRRGDRSRQGRRRPGDDRRQQDRQGGRDAGQGPRRARQPRPQPRGLGRGHRLLRRLGQDPRGPRQPPAHDPARHRARGPEGESGRPRLREP